MILDKIWPTSWIGWCRKVLPSARLQRIQVHQLKIQVSGEDQIIICFQFSVSAFGNSVRHREFVNNVHKDAF